MGGQAVERRAAIVVDEDSKSRRLRTLATLLTSALFFPVSCTSGFYIANAVTGAIADRSEQIPYDEEDPPRHSVAVIATPVGAPASAALIYWVKDPERDSAEFRLKHPGYSFLPPSDQGRISRPDLESYVDYQVVRRHSEKALVKTHEHHYPMIISLDIRATYEATESEIRLISYRVGSDTPNGIVAGPALGCALALLGEVLKRRLGTPLAEDAEAKSQHDARRVERRRKIAGVLSLIGVALGVLGSVAGSLLFAVEGSVLFVLAGLMWSILTLHGSRRNSWRHQRPGR